MINRQKTSRAKDAASNIHIYTVCSNFAIYCLKSNQNITGYDLL